MPTNRTPSASLSAPRCERDPPGADVDDPSPLALAARRYDDAVTPTPGSTPRGATPAKSGFAGRPGTGADARHAADAAGRRAASGAQLTPHAP